MKNTHYTIRDVARLAGVSHQTVSRVINKVEKVSPGTREKVERVIEELNYQPNAIARSMARGKTRTLACLSPNLTDFTFASIIEGAEQKAREVGYYLLSSSCSDEDTFAEIVHELVGRRRIDGLIIINPYIDYRYEFIPAHFPTIFVGDESKDDEIAWVALDDELAGYMAVKHLIGLGHREILCIQGTISDACTQNRTLGYFRALQEEQISPKETLLFCGDWTATSGYKSIETALEKDQKFSAVFAQNDRMAIGAMHALRNANIQIPQQVSVIGFDDMPLASYFDPPLTTIRQDFNQIGQEAARTLIHKIEHPDENETSHRIAVELVERQSTALKSGGEHIER
jgi:LacI family repressor for deo operon, udp, cdd, tsx, nupC, and nupG